MPASVRPSRKEAKIVYRLKQTPKELQQAPVMDKSLQPIAKLTGNSKRRYSWYKDSQGAQ